MEAASTSSRRALITGIAGQDGSYLAELLLGAGYEVHGVVAGDLTASRPNLVDVVDRLTLYQSNLASAAEVRELLQATTPHEIYNLAAPSNVYASWDDPAATLSFFTLSIVALLEAMREHAHDARLFHASSSEIFRGSGVAPQNEQTPPAPRSPYGAGKLLTQNLVDSYRRQYGLHASCGILYNHESPRRPATFVTQKIVRGAVAIKLGAAETLQLGNTSAQRDWGYAGDYVQAMHLMLAQDEPDDYVIASGTLHSVADVVEAVFGRLELNVEEHVTQDQSLFRTHDDAVLVGDASKARERLGWQPATGFEQWLGMMVDAELARQSATV